MTPVRHPAGWEKRERWTGHGGLEGPVCEGAGEGKARLSTAAHCDALSAEAPRGDPGEAPPETTPYSEFQVPHSCPFTSPRLPGCLTGCQLEQGPKWRLLREPGGQRGGRKVDMGISTGQRLWSILPGHPRGSASSHP